MNAYKIEDHYLMNTVKMLEYHKATRYNGSIENWVEEGLMSREEKIAFVDANWQKAENCCCSLSTLLAIMESYQEAVKSGEIKGKVYHWKSDDSFEPNTNSYIGWARRTNKKYNATILSESSWRDSFGKVYGYDFRLHIWDKVVSHTEYGYSEKYDEGDIVDQVFYDLLKKLYLKEIEHFKATDPKEIRIAKCKEYMQNGLPNLSDNIWNACMNGKHELVTDEELIVAIHAYKEMLKSIAEITKKAKKDLEVIKSSKN